MDEGLTCKISKFADDTKITGRVTTTTEKAQLQSDLDRLVTWSNKWQMAYNVNKCKVLHIGNNNHRTNYSMNGAVIPKVTEEKDLGVIIRVPLIFFLLLFLFLFFYFFLSFFLCIFFFFYLFIIIITIIIIINFIVIIIIFLLLLLLFYYPLSPRFWHLLLMLCFLSSIINTHTHTHTHTHTYTHVIHIHKHSHTVFYYLLAYSPGLFLR